MKILIKLTVTIFACGLLAFSAHGSNRANNTNSSNGTDRNLTIKNTTDEYISFYYYGKPDCMYVREIKPIAPGKTGVWRFEEDASGSCAMSDKKVSFDIDAEGAESSIGGWEMSATFHTIGANDRYWRWKGPATKWKDDKSPNLNGNESIELTVYKIKKDRKTEYLWDDNI